MPKKTVNSGRVFNAIAAVRKLHLEARELTSLVEYHRFRDDIAQLHDEVVTVAIMAELKVFNNASSSSLTTAELLNQSGGIKGMLRNTTDPEQEELDV